MDMTMHEHQPYSPSGSHSSRNIHRNYTSDTHWLESDQFDYACTSVDRRTFGSQHLLFHFSGIPEDNEIDLTAVQIGVEALRVSHQNTEQAWHELEAQQPNIVSLSLELDYGHNPSPGYLRTYYDDKTHRTARHERTKFIGSLLATDRIVRSWHQDICCRLYQCLHNSFFDQRPESVPIVPLRSVLSTMYDDQLSSQHWFRDVVARHVSLAFDNLSPKEKELHWDVQGNSTEPNAWQREMSDNHAREEIILRASRCAIMLADSYALVSPGILLIRGGDELPPRGPKGSY